MYRSIIVPVDASARSVAAIPIGARLARAADATLDVIRVHLEDRPDLADDPSWDVMFREGERRHLEALAMAYEPDARRPISATLLDGNVVDALVGFAEQRPDPLFVMSSRARVGLRRTLFGSTADGLIHAVTTPVLVLHDRHPEDHPARYLSDLSFAKVVLPLDGTSHAEAGIAHAAAFASMTGARLHLVRIVEPLVGGAIIGAFAMHPVLPFEESTPVRQEQAVEYLRGVAARIQAQFPALEITVDVLVSGDPGGEIVDYCSGIGAELVVLPTHARGASRLVIGAVGDRLLSDGPPAVLFVPPSRAARGAEAERLRAPEPVPLTVN